MPHPQIGELALACPKLKVLVTSRERLHLHDERIYRVNPLALSDPTTSSSIDEPVPSPAAQLFAMRAQAVLPDFQLSASNAPVVDAICRQLDGLPLAIELAAPWIRLFSPSELLVRLETSIAAPYARCARSTRAVANHARRNRLELRPPQ